MKGLPQADKNFGQHFLINLNTIERITTTPKEFDSVIEVGPGPGVLTRKLPLDHLYLVEKDKRFTELLQEIVPPERIFMTDALDFDFTSIPGQKIWLVSNLPYNVSAPLTIRFLQLKNILTMTLMYQKEVASKILARDEMNSLGALCQNYFKVESLIKVSPGSFSPPPKVQSEVLTYTRLPAPTISLEDFFTFESFLRSLYREKRKTLFNNLKKVYEPELIRKVLNKVQIAEGLRAERLSLNEVQNLFQEIRCELKDKA
jgi:16S rRNA (adenine1518-N6/adenine1519-N6)-dimethyltransferase